MKIFKDILQIQKITSQLRREGHVIGFVPTMGYLHEGHMSLIKQAKRENDSVVVSIFVNPLQFGPKEDFKKYPRDIKRDESLCENLNVHYLFYPNISDIYQVGFQTYVNVQKLTDKLEGRSRPSHFVGVTTVVCKLFNIIKPHKAYFGRKDAQQLLVIKRMVEDLNMDIDIVDVSIVRANDGLALSSRNIYLKEDERKDAVCLYRALNVAKEMIYSNILDTKSIKEKMKNIINEYEKASIDYISINSLNDLDELDTVQKNNTLISLAVFIGNVRLIDNMWF